jgi:NAD(P)-dependent dehydrogenase (short-subunit alcohol dehydrogenase family)
MGSMDGRTVVITGGNAGIGKETAVALAADGARVIFTSRDAGRGAAALAEITERSGSSTVEVMALDLSSLASVRAFSEQVLDATERIDVLVNNAGLILDQRTETEDGFEMTFGVNHLGHFLLTDLLRDRLLASAPARVVVLSSNAHTFARSGLDFDDLQSTRKYSSFGAYSRSKLANILFTNELARQLDGTGVTANSVHPGWVDSRFGRDGDIGALEWVFGLGGRLFAISPERGAETSVFLARDPGVADTNGSYFVKSKVRRTSSHGADAAAATRLWEISADLVGA